MERVVDNNKIINILKDIEKKYFGRNLCLFVLGMILSALGYNLFFSPYNVVPTGSSGLVLLLSEYFSFDASLVQLYINIIIFFIALLFFGLEYSLKIIPITIFYPFFLKSISLITRLIDLEGTSLFLIMIFGGILMGLSSGIIRKSGYNPGGFAIIYDILNKYLHISIGLSGLVVNMIIIVISGFRFGIDNAIYAIISLVVSSYIVDKVVIGISNNKVFYIITSKPLEVRDYITYKLNYSTTIINARGGYTNKKRKMLMCVVPTIEYLKLKELVSKIDPNVFFLIVDTYDSSVKKNCKNM